MRILLILLTTLLLSCSTTDKKRGLFDNLTDKETVVVILSKYNLDGVPSEIGRLANTKRLYITADSGGHTIYPPLGTSAQPTYSTYPALDERLPDEITTLTNLTYLGLVRLNLTALPDDFGKLTGLDTLDLSFNRLKISKEIEKLKQFKDLKFLGLMGNLVDSTDIVQLKKDNPNLKIQTWIE